MQIRRIRIENFRCVRELELDLDETTVFIGANNTGKTAIMEGVRIALSRRWGRRGTGFVEFDVHRGEAALNPREAPPVRVYLHFEECSDDPWDPDMVAVLDDITALAKNGSNQISLRVTCQWSEESEAFEPSWEFLDTAGKPFGRARRATNFSPFFSYALLFYLPALRDAAEEFGPRSPIWGRLLKSVRIPDTVEASVQTTLDGLDTELLAADPRLADIAAKIALAAKVTVGQSEGDARLRMLPMNTWDLISRASVVLKNENLRPWLPLDHHGQGLQSLSVLFLFQAAVFQQLEDEQPGTEPIFLLEEPEAHLHPQAARTLWEHVDKLPGQKLITTHSPYFVQNVPLHNLRLVTLKNGESEVASLPRRIESALPWNESVAKFAAHQGSMLVKSAVSGNVAATSWFNSDVADGLKGCFKDDKDQAQVNSVIGDFRHRCRCLITKQEEHELSFLGRRIRGEIFFARQWILVEGQSEYVLLHAIGRALEYPLDRHGIAVIDFQNNGDADIYPALATAFSIPWQMVTDGDAAADGFRGQIIKRGFTPEELQGRLHTLPSPNSLEDQLIADGHEKRLREILAAVTSDTALTCSFEDFVKRLKKKKIACISRLALQIEGNETLAREMPKAFLTQVLAMKGVNNDARA